MRSYAEFLSRLSAQCRKGKDYLQSMISKIVLRLICNGDDVKISMPRYPISEHRRVVQKAHTTIHTHTILATFWPVTIHTVCCPWATCRFERRFYITDCENVISWRNRGAGSKTCQIILQGACMTQWVMTKPCQTVRHSMEQYGICWPYRSVAVCSNHNLLSFISSSTALFFVWIFSYINNFSGGALTVFFDMVVPMAFLWKSLLWARILHLHTEPHIGNNIASESWEGHRISRRQCSWDPQLSFTCVCPIFWG